jgi:hypothetical protein
VRSGGRIRHIWRCNRLGSDILTSAGRPRPMVCLRDL